LTQYKTVTVDGNTDVPTDAVSAPAVSITGYISATIPTELLSVETPLPTETEEPMYTIQTSVPVMTSSYIFSTLKLPVNNETTTGIFYSGTMANSSVLHPTPFFPNTSSAHSHYALPTINIARAAETPGPSKGAAFKSGVSFFALVLSMMVTAFFC
jgi:hypothetical protein